MMITQEGRSRQVVILALALASVGLVYLIQAATPLRLDDDAVDYLNAATVLVDGHPLPGRPATIPLGFPTVIAALDRAGAGSSFWFVIANCFFIAVGLVSCWHLLKPLQTRSRQWVCLLTLLMVPVVKSVPIALPEAAFFGTSLLALGAISSVRVATSRRRSTILLLAVLLTAIATSMRIVGLALVPVLIWNGFLASRNETARMSDRRLLLWSALPVAAVIGVLLILVVRSNAFALYSINLQDYYSHRTILAQLSRRASLAVSDLGEVGLNLPFSRFRDWRLLFIIAGIFFGGLLWLALKKPAKAPAARMYLLVYLLGLVVWPDPSTRLWMPIIPLLIAEIITLLDGMRGPIWSLIAGAYVAWIGITGVVALAYTTRISLSGSEFSNVYGLNGGMPSAEAASDPARADHLRMYIAAAARLNARYGKH
jgi:hypothetical protein